MKSKGNFSGKSLMRSFIRLISTPFSSHSHVRVEVPNPTETVHRYPTTFIYDHLQFFNPEFNPSVHSIDEVIPFRPMEDAKSRNLYKPAKEVDVKRKVSSPIRSLNQK